MIEATKTSGLGLATTTVAKQYEHLVKEFPDIKDVHRWGTLNLQLEYPLRIVNHDYTTSPIEWEPGFQEQFSLTRIDLQLSTRAAKPQPAWIYVAHRSPHRANTLFIELLTATLQVKNGDRLLVRLPSYRYSSCILL
jgi:hypothetical protein